MTRAFQLLLLGTALGLAACDGPRENAGEKADAAAGRVESEDTLRSGPAEEMGARQDAAVDAKADALEAEAESLESEAEERRENARQRADALRKDAEAARKVEPAPQPEPEINGM